MTRPSTVDPPPAYVAHRRILAGIVILAAAALLFVVLIDVQPVTQGLLSAANSFRKAWTSWHWTLF